MDVLVAREASSTAVIAVDGHCLKRFLFRDRPDPSVAIIRGFGLIWIPDPV